MRLEWARLSPAQTPSGEMSVRAISREGGVLGVCGRQSYPLSMTRAATSSAD